MSGTELSAHTCWLLLFSTRTECILFSFTMLTTNNFASLFGTNAFRKGSTLIPQYMCWVSVNL